MSLVRRIPTLSTTQNQLLPSLTNAIAEVGGTIRSKDAADAIEADLSWKVQLSVSISWIAQGAQSSSGDDVRHGEGIAPQQLM
jgi:hypothetical protein